ncbi:MAG: hypothetical protein KJZ73_12070 [Pseudorhodoplanes sp.]|nr:hypothetical protein [Pseudorhodoplanes sp.]
MARRSVGQTKTPASQPPQPVQADKSLDELRSEWRRLLTPNIRAMTRSVRP